MKYYDSNPPCFYDDPSVVYDDIFIPWSSNGSKKMKYMALKLGEKTLDQKLVLTTDLGAALGLNIALYALPDPTVAELTARVLAIRNKKGELDAAIALVDIKQGELDALEVDLDDALIKEGAYIQKASGGVEANIKLLGLDVKSSPSLPAGPAKLQNFRLLPGLKGGQVKTACKPDRGALTYDYEFTTDPTKEENWKHLGVSSGCRMTFSGLTTGAVIWIRARSVGKKNVGFGPWSDPATITVP